MAPYDSESSGGEDDDYTETNVLLGYASKEASDDTISHLGGRPEWLDPAIPPSAALAKCKVCHDIMVLLLQLNGDLPEHFWGHERRLYVLTCRRKTCRRKEGSVRVLRGTRISALSKEDKKGKQAAKKEASAPKPAMNIGETLFGSKPFSGSFSETPFSSSSSNPFSDPSTTPQNPFSAGGLRPASELAAKPPQNPSEETTTDLPKTFALALSLNSPSPSAFGPLPPPEPWPLETSLPPAYAVLYLVDADYEMLDKVEEAPIPVPTMDLDDSNGGSGKEDKYIHEDSIDKTFQRFADRLAQNPEQVIRYEFKGAPLLYSKTDPVGKLLTAPGRNDGNEKVRVASASANGIPKCRTCGARRVFEVQLTPHAIMELEKDEEGIDGMEWGTIHVGVCEKDCVPSGVGNGEVGYVEEWVGVQWEELTASK